MARFNIRRDLLGGQFLSKRQMAGQWLFIIYIFFLIVLYITINLGFERTQLAIAKNQAELKSLKADYTSKAAKLQYGSKREEIEERLVVSGSTLKAPEKPAYRVKTDLNTE